MAIIEPVKEDIEHPEHIKTYSAPLRLWHWLNLIIISGSLLTVLVDSTLLKKRTIRQVIKSELGNVSDQQAKSIAHTLNDKVWEFHTYFGYVLAALLLFRIGMEFFQKRDQKLFRKVKSAYQQYHIFKKNRKLARHELLVKVLYFVFYLLILVMVCTGLSLAFEDDIPALKAIHAIRQIHSFCMYLILAFIVVHIIGVLLAERKEGKGIVSDMINGGG